MSFPASTVTRPGRQSKDEKWYEWHTIAATIRPRFHQRITSNTAGSRRNDRFAQQPPR